MVTPQRRAVVGWCLYDWANSAFPTVVSTFVFAAYFTKGVAANEAEGLVEHGRDLFDGVGVDGGDDARGLPAVLLRGVSAHGDDARVAGVGVTEHGLEPALIVDALRGTPTRRFSSFAATRALNSISRRRSSSLRT